MSVLLTDALTTQRTAERGIHMRLHDESEELIDSLESKLSAAEREIAALRLKLRDKKACSVRCVELMC